MLIINKVAVCIDQMQRPGVFLLFEKKINWVWGTRWLLKAKLKG